MLLPPAFTAAYMPFQAYLFRRPAAWFRYAKSFLSQILLFHELLKRLTMFKSTLCFAAEYFHFDKPTPLTSPQLFRWQNSRLISGNTFTIRHYCLFDDDRWWHLILKYCLLCRAHRFRFHGYYAAYLFTISWRASI
jgi:hypothetical protein